MITRRATLRFALAAGVAAIPLPASAGTQPPMPLGVYQFIGLRRTAAPGDADWRGRDVVAVNLEVDADGHWTLEMDGPAAQPGGPGVTLYATEGGPDDPRLALLRLLIDPAPTVALAGA